MVIFHLIFFLFFSRLAALKKNGEENWKKKVPKVEISTVTTPASRKTSSISVSGNSENAALTGSRKTSSIITERKTSSIITEDNANLLDDKNGNNQVHDELSPVTLREKKSSVNRPGGKVGSLQVSKVLRILKGIYLIRKLHGRA